MDVVVTVPKNFRFDGKVGYEAWLDEGDGPGEPWSGRYYEFGLAYTRPSIEKGERVYVVCNGRLRGYAPLVLVERSLDGRHNLIRGGGAVAVTVGFPIKGFRGFRYRWWERSVEQAY